MQLDTIPLKDKNRALFPSASSRIPAALTGFQWMSQWREWFWLPARCEWHASFGGGQIAPKLPRRGWTQKRCARGKAACHRAIPVSFARWIFKYYYYFCTAYYRVVCIKFVSTLCIQWYYTNISIYVLDYTGAGSLKIHNVSLFSHYKNILDFYTSICHGWRCLKYTLSLRICVYRNLVCCRKFNATEQHEPLWIIILDCRICNYQKWEIKTF